MSAVDYRGQTTIVTGASAGIGAEFARQLAARGSHLVLVARRLDRLERLAAELTAAHGVRVTPVALDLSAPGAGAALAAEVDRRGLRVTGLVNNAGFGTHGPFHAEDPARVQEEIAVNVAALVDLSRTFVGRLREAGTGVLVNVASTIAYQPAPGMAVYGATKAFVLSFTEALWRETRGSGLRVLALSPGATSTEFFDVLGARVDGARGHQSPAEVVDTALRALDRRDPPPSVVAGRVNRVLSLAGRVVTRRGTLRIMEAMTRPA
ncbi:SDR family NAD(P)-dependent oxidoreductase [Kineococcus sp. NUM-3379]